MSYTLGLHHDSNAITTNGSVAQSMPELTDLTKRILELHVKPFYSNEHTDLYFLNSAEMELFTADMILAYAMLVRGK